MLREGLGDELDGGWLVCFVVWMVWHWRCLGTIGILKSNMCIANYLLAGREQQTGIR